MSTTPEPAPALKALYRRVLDGDPAPTQIWFDARVLDRYRGLAGTRVIRTNSVGQIRSAAGWTLDFGVAPGDRLLHATLADLSERLPSAERDHWLDHLLTPPLSTTFLMMRMAGAACIDDGELRDWFR